MTTPTWTEVLDDFEAELARAEALLSRATSAASAPEAAVTPWSPPPGLGPLSPDDAPRAAAVLERQRAVVDRLQSAATRTRTELEYVEALSRGPERAPAAFVDRAL